MQPPKLFISYSWTTPDHEEWVLRLATELVNSGIEVKLDKWDLREGQDSVHFMEQMVSDPSITKVIMVCDQKYKIRADSRERGVGLETQIISNEIYESTTQTKFVAVISELDEVGNPFIPVYYKGKIHIDLSDEEKYSKNFEQLLRWIVDKPLYIRPPLGKIPAYILENNPTILGTEVAARRFKDALKTGKAYASGALIEYFNILHQNLERFWIQGVVFEEGKEVDTVIFKNIEEFLPYRNEVLSIFETIAIYGNIQENAQTIYSFFENLTNYFVPRKPEGGSYSYRECDFDFYKFITYELILYAVAIFIKYEKFGAVSTILNHRYYVVADNSNSRKEALSISALNPHIESLNRYYQVQFNRRPFSPMGELISTRLNTHIINIDQLAQADFIAFLILESNRTIGDRHWDRWYPRMPLYNNNRRSAYEVFARASSKSYFDKIKILFLIQTKDELVPMFSNFINYPDMLPQVGDWDKLNVLELSNYEKLATER